MKEEKEDFFDQIPEDKPVKPKEPKRPALRPDDPLYYDQEESDWEHLSPSPYRRNRILLTVFGLLVIAGLFACVYIYFFTPRVDDAEEYGYVENVYRDGTFFKSYEGTMLPYRSVKDMLRPYENDFVFSIKDVEVAKELKRQIASGHPVKVRYEVYRQRLPWRGNSVVLVTAVDSVENPGALLPPERQPSHK